MTVTSVPAARVSAGIPITIRLAKRRVARGQVLADQTLVEYEGLVTETLADQLGINYSDVSGLVMAHLGILEGGYEDQAREHEIASQALVGGGL